MIIKNVNIFRKDTETNAPAYFEKGCIVTDGGRIRAVVTDGSVPQGADTIDGGGAYAVPGLIDLHFHGCMGDDFCDADAAALARIAAYEASVGVTAIAPATMTLPVDELERILRTAAAYARSAADDRTEEKAPRADLVGINMEGPFISPVKKGAQDAQYILPADAALAERFFDWSDGLVRFIGLAPEECADAAGFIRAVGGSAHVALAHTNADYDTAMAAFSAGADHAVHLHNAMPELLHRDPGVVGAVYDSPHVTAELICDGIHVHPSVVWTTYRQIGEDRLILISDSMRAAGMPDGTYTLGGLDVNVRGRLATLVSDGAIAGSATDLMECLRIAVLRMKLPLTAAVTAATVNPARALGILQERGTLEEGKRADIVLLDQALGLQTVIKDGTCIRARG